MKGPRVPNGCSKDPFAWGKYKPPVARLTVLIVSALLVAACNTTATGGRDSKLSWWKKIPVEDLIVNVSDIPEINLSDAKQKSIGRTEIR